MYAALFLTTDQIPPADDHHTYLWILVLMAAIVASIVGTVIDNIVKGSSKRPHNAILLFNDSLAEHQVAYIVFFIAIATGATFGRFWGSGLTQIAVLLAICFYVSGLYSTTQHDIKISRDHVCGGNPHCPTRLRFTTIARLCGMNTLFAAIMLAIGIYLATITAKTP